MSRMMVLWMLIYAAVSGSAQEIRIDFDHKCDFSRYKTYSWSASSDPQFPNQLMQQRIVGMVEEALAAKQLKRLESGGDLLVDYQFNAAPQPRYTTFTNSTGPGWGGGWGWGWNDAISTTTVETIALGTLMVNLTDSHRKQLVFQATATDTLSSRPEKNIKRLRKGVDKMFEKYPPR